MNEDQDDWDLHIDAVLFGYRVAKHSSTGYSPFYMLFHREPRLPIDAELIAQHPSESTDIDSNIETMLQIQRDVQVEAMGNITSAQKRQKKNYDKRHEVKVCNISF